MIVRNWLLSGATMVIGLGTGCARAPAPHLASDVEKAGARVQPNPDGNFPIKHVVFLVKENRTFDNCFGQFPGANGATTGQKSDGSTTPLAPMPDSISPDISHAWDAALAACDNGKMDGFDKLPGTQGGRNNYVQAGPQDIPNYWSLAQQYVLDDNFFSSLHGPGFPNHLYTIAAQSGGVTDNPRNANPRRRGKASAATATPAPRLSRAHSRVCPVCAPRTCRRLRKARPGAATIRPTCACRCSTRRARWRRSIPAPTSRPWATS